MHQDKLRASPRQRRQRLFALLALIFLCAPGVLAQSTRRPRAQTAKTPAEKKVSPLEKQKQQAAEDAADRFMQRFYETLDMGVVLKEFTVSNPSLRQADVWVLTQNVPYAPEAKIDYAARERLYIAQLNLRFLLIAVSLTAPDSIETLEKNQEFTSRYESISGMTTKLATSADLDEQVTNVLNLINAQLRGHVDPAAYNSPAYRDRVSKVKEDMADETERLREVFAPAGLTNDTKLYVVRREMHYLYFIEEPTGFKLLTFSSRHQD